MNSYFYTQLAMREERKQAAHTRRQTAGYRRRRRDAFGHAPGLWLAASECGMSETEVFRYSDYLDARQNVRLKKS